MKHIIIFLLLFVKTGNAIRINDLISTIEIIVNDFVDENSYNDGKAETVLQSRNLASVDLCAYLAKNQTAADGLTSSIGDSIAEAKLTCTQECRNNVVLASCLAGCEVCSGAESITNTSFTENGNYCGRPSIASVMDFSEDISDPKISVLSCAKYTRGLHTGNEVCVKQNYAGVDCEVRYNNDTCTSCEDIECENYDLQVKADCTNIESGAQINVCTNEGNVGVFQLVAFLEDENVQLHTGTCYEVETSKDVDDTAATTETTTTEDNVDTEKVEDSISSGSIIFGRLMGYSSMIGTAVVWFII